MCLPISSSKGLAHQQKPFPGHHAKHVRAEEDAPGEDGGNRHEAAQHHYPDGDSQAGIQIADQRLKQERDADHHAKLLGQHEARSHVDLRIEIVEVHAQENAGQGYEDAHQPAVIEQVDGGIDRDNQICGQDKRRCYERDFRDEESQRADRDENAKYSNHSRFRETISTSVSH
jgi:hypothetical protein